MKQMSLQQKSFFPVCLIGILCFFCSCHSGTSKEDNAFSNDSTVIATGKFLFEKNCSACHGFSKDEIGPALGHVTGEASAEWLHRFIKDPQQMFSSGDKRAIELRKTFKTVMPSFAALKDDEVGALLAFIYANKVSAPLANKGDKGIQDPIPEKIKSSSLVVDLEQVAQFPATNNKDELPVTRITKMSFLPHIGTIFVNTGIM